MTAGLTLMEIRARFPALFYRQSWFDGEAFTRVLPNETHTAAPSATRPGIVPRTSKGLPLAVDLANAYVRTATDPVWEGYLWCRDTDALGQRVYLGGTANGHGLEIHRHIHVTDRFSVPVWRS